jgi:hypothetical protein
VACTLGALYAAGLAAGGSRPQVGSLPTAPEAIDPEPPAHAEGPPIIVPTPEAPQFVRVANTGGQGVILRREPTTAAPRVAVRAENTVLKVSGPEELVEGRTWRPVEDAQGNQGWTPAEFLLPAPAP